MLTQKELKQHIHYDPETGVFTRIYSRNRNDRVRKEAGTITSKGYRRMLVLNRLYYASNLAHLYMTGEWPIGEMDHRNGVRDDNRWLNLRDISSAENNEASRKRKAALEKLERL